MKKAAFVGLGLLFCIAAPAFSRSYLDSNAVVDPLVLRHNISIEHIESSQTAHFPGRICTN